MKTMLKATTAVSALLIGQASPAQSGDWTGANNNGVTMSGQIVRSLVWIDDRWRDELFHVDGASDNSRLRWVVKGTMTEDLAVGGLIELDFPLSSPAADGHFKQDLRGTYWHGPDADDISPIYESSEDRPDWSIRHTKIDFRHKSYGVFSIGHSSTATDGAFERHLGGLAHLSLGGCDAACKNQFPTGNGEIYPVPVTLRDYYIWDWPRPAGDGQVQAARVDYVIEAGEALSDHDGGRDDRLRYDTPTIGGFKAAASIMQGGAWDIAGYYDGTFNTSGINLAAAAGYRRVNPVDDHILAYYGGSLAVKHRDSGLNASAAWSKKHARTRHSPSRVPPIHLPIWEGVPEGREWMQPVGDGQHWHAALGWDAELTDLGTTSFTAIYGRNSDVLIGDDKSYYWKLVANQQLPAGVDVFAAFSRYSYDEADDIMGNNIYYGDMTIAMAGGRLMF